MLEGLDDLILIWHIRYGNVDAQTDVWEDKAAEMMPMFESANVTAIHFESAHRDFREMESYRGFPLNLHLQLLPDILAKRLGRKRGGEGKQRFICVFSQEYRSGHGCRTQS